MHSTFCLLCCLVLFGSWTEAQNFSEYSDFNPLYETKNKNLLLTQIDYTKNKTIFYLRYVAEKEKDPLRFYGKEEPQRFKLLAIGGEFLNWEVDVENIRIDNELQISKVPTDIQVQYIPRKGAVLSFELHSEPLPEGLKKVSLLNGDLDKKEVARFECSNIVLKSPNSSDLGNIRLMNEAIMDFYSQFNYMRAPNLNEITSLAMEEQFHQEKEEAKQRNQETQIQGSMAPVDYMPESLGSEAMESDFNCRERIILKDLQFEDNKAEFSNRSQANKILAVVASYLKNNPDNKVTLHGHTDIFGDEYDNLLLSKSRVFEVKQVLISKGIPKERIVTLYHGGGQPLPLYKDGGDMNRRVEAEIICQE